MRSVTAEYAVYKKEDTIALGTIEECAKTLNIKPESVAYYGTPTYKKRTKNGRVLVKLEEEAN